MNAQKTRHVETSEYTAPAAWASYLINGDASGLTDEEVDQCNEWLSTIDGEVVDVSEAEFMTFHDAREFAPYAADCATYTFIIYSNRTDGR